MPWTLDKSNASFSNWYTMTQTEKDNWDKFQNAVTQGMHPAQAAGQVGTVAHKANADYKCLNGDQYQIRLSYNNRATFRVITGTQTVIVLQVGGHT